MGRCVRAARARALFCSCAALLDSLGMSCKCVCVCASCIFQYTRSDSCCLEWCSFYSFYMARTDIIMVCITKYFMYHLHHWGNMYLTLRYHECAPLPPLLLYCLSGCRGEYCVRLRCGWLRLNVKRICVTPRSKYAWHAECEASAAHRYECPPPPKKTGGRYETGSASD